MGADTKEALAARALHRGLTQVVIISTLEMLQYTFRPSKQEYKINYCTFVPSVLAISLFYVTKLNTKKYVLFYLSSKNTRK